MLLIIIIAIISLIILIILHELGHFILAKKFGVRVDEFGIGYPPRIWGKKIGETMYSINLLPFGAFVKIFGEEERKKDSRSFSTKPIWKRALIVLGGVVSFWLVGAILLSVVFVIGTHQVVDDSANQGLVDPRVQIIAVSPGSPAEAVGISVGDSIIRIRNQESGIRNINKVKEVQEFTQIHKGKEITLTIQRGKEVFDVSLVPRISYPEGDGAMGVGLVRTALKSYSWHQASIEGIKTTGFLTRFVVESFYQILKSVFQGKGLPAGVKIVGPVGIFNLFAQVGQLGANYFLQFVAIISVYLAIFNLLPIPALDGGKLLFLAIEAVKGKPVSQKIEQKLTAFFFTLLILLMIWVTIKDVMRLF